MNGTSDGSGTTRSMRGKMMVLIIDDDIFYYNIIL